MRGQAELILDTAIRSRFYRFLFNQAQRLVGWLLFDTRRNGEQDDGWKQE